MINKFRFQENNPLKFKNNKKNNYKNKSNIYELKLR